MLHTQALMRLGAALLCLLALAGPAAAGGRAARFLAESAPSAEVGSQGQCLCRCCGQVLPRCTAPESGYCCRCRLLSLPPPLPPPLLPPALTAWLTASNPPRQQASPCPLASLPPLFPAPAQRHGL